MPYILSGLERDMNPTVSAHHYINEQDKMLRRYLHTGQERIRIDPCLSLLLLFYHVKFILLHFISLYPLSYFTISSFLYVSGKTKLEKHGVRVR